MKTYDETFERVMAERDSYMLKRKKTIKCAALGSTALVAVALCVFTATRAGNTGMINKKSADNNSEAAIVSDDSKYTVPELLSQEITSYFNLDRDTERTEENGTHKAKDESTTLPATVKQDKDGDYDSLEETATAAPATSTRADSNANITTTRPATEKAIIEAETAVSSEYKYHINSGKYKNYVAGKVIDKDKVGEKAGSVTVTAGWEGPGAVAEGNTAKETLSADVYYIKGVSDDVAVCLKFKDKGDALTTTHYYVVINPEADSSAVSDYVIGGSAPSTVQTPANGDYVIETTKGYTVME
ncbi:MAG: hypothetical protein IKH65_03730 [Clostridia bacterium]|nr:hypothetical protein [Clostridia bacterium]